MKGLKLTRGVCCLLLPSGIDFPEASTFLKRATLRLEEPVLPLARDNRLWGGGSDGEGRAKQTNTHQQTNKAFLIGAKDARSGCRETLLHDRRRAGT